MMVRPGVIFSGFVLENKFSLSNKSNIPEERGGETEPRVWCSSSRSVTSLILPVVIVTCFKDEKNNHLPSYPPDLTSCSLRLWVLWFLLKLKFMLFIYAVFPSNYDARNWILKKLSSFQVWIFWRFLKEVLPQAIKPGDCQTWSIIFCARNPHHTQIYINPASTDLNKPSLLPLPITALNLAVLKSSAYPLVPHIEAPQHQDQGQRK